MKQSATRLSITPQGDTITVLEGTQETLPVAHPKPITINGTLQAPYQYFIGKKPAAKDCHILIDNIKGELTLKIDDRNKFSECIIVGKLQENVTLKAFEINGVKRYGIQEFLKFIRQYRYCFSDKAVHAKLIESIQRWSVKIEKVISEYNDNKGNSNFHFETKVQSVEGLITSFDLSIPIFQGYPSIKFTVEIGLDPKNTAVQIYLISDELYELEAKERDRCFSLELKKFEDFECSKVVIS